MTTERGATKHIQVERLVMVSKAALFLCEHGFTLKRDLWVKDGCPAGTDSVNLANKVRYQELVEEAGGSLRDAWVAEGDFTNMTITLESR